MRFETRELHQAEGWYLAHSHVLKDSKIAKNTLITAALIKDLLADGLQKVDAYRLEGSDLDENSAAEMLARAISGENTYSEPANRGRANIYAKEAGLFMPDALVNDINRLSGDIGVACLPRLTPVQKGKLLATIKIIPYGLDRSLVEKACRTKQAMKVAPFSPFNGELIMSGHGMTEKALKVTENRLAALRGNITSVSNCEHTVEAISERLKRSREKLVLISGVSAISDRRDIVPKALEAAGGKIVHLGMPVDPGNLLMLGELDGKTVIGMPGCAKSPTLNGFDWVLERYAAGLPITSETIQQMGIGGLLKEPAERPSPRAPRRENDACKTQAIILAAGTSSRSGKTNKLLAILDGKPVIEQTVLSLKNADIKDIIVVTGARSAEIEQALTGHKVTMVHNELYAKGMAGSLAAGISALAGQTTQALVCLGDMPFVSPDTYKNLIRASNRVSEASIFTPRFKGKRGNPVLWRNTLFEALMGLSGDTGGRYIIQQNKDAVCEVTVEDPGILIDLDTPEALAQFGIRVTEP